MTQTLLSNSGIEATYRERTPRSADRARRARSILPSGIAHDARKLDPYPIYCDRALGARKWDIDGNEYVDYYGGHGALILGHCDPAVTEAVHRQLDLGSHYAACHELEVEWGARVIDMVPCAERVRFTSSGTEANLMALRLARAYTGKTKLVRFMGHFHGWQDHVAFGIEDHFDGSPSPGVLDGIAENVLLAPSDDIDAVTGLFESRDDIAAVILEPTGASFGVVPIRHEFVAALRRLTEAHGAVLIFDEVVTGFRVAEGGAQQLHGITPDMATFAKILAGGLPGGAVTGSVAIMELLDFEAAAAKGFEKIVHHGTYNANPVCASAGIACLDRLRETNACERASEIAARLRERLNQTFAEEDLAWAVYGEHSGLYFYTNPESRALDPIRFDPGELTFQELKQGGKHPAAKRFRLALMLGGVDFSAKPGGTVSAVHGDDDIDRTAAAVRDAIRMLRAEGEL